MDLKKYMQRNGGIKGIKEIADKCGVHHMYLVSCYSKNNKKRPSIKLCHKLIKHSSGQMTMEALRPDVFDSSIDP